MIELIFQTFNGCSWWVWLFVNFYVLILSFIWLSLFDGLRISFVILLLILKYSLELVILFKKIHLVHVMSMESFVWSVFILVFSI